jgi:D-3-phosphoglycerate dehydrogenase / 2-oxoglutarate reductase
MRMRVVVVDANFPELREEKAATERAGASFVFANTSDPERIAEAVEGAKVVLVQFAPFGRSALERLAAGARVIRYGVGYDNIDLDAAHELGVSVAYVPDYCTEEVADHTASLVLCLLRKVVLADRHVRDGHWSPVAASAPLAPFSKTAIGFLGFGRIAQAVRDRLRPFGFSFIYHDPAVEQQRANVGALAVPLEDLVRQADVLSLHLPSTRETRHIINRHRLTAMKNTAFIVNTARGDLVDTPALAEALADGHIAGAALDVFEKEPLPADHPIRFAGTALLTPHSAWYSEESIASLQRLAADEVRRALNGELARQPVPHQTPATA